MATAAHGGQEDLLTRTMLRFGPSASSIEQLVRALQRVPGVLTVEADAIHAEALVAHDGAVPVASLVAAANTAGRAVDVVTASPDGVVPTATSPMSHGKYARLKSAAVMAILAVIIIDMIFPSSPEKRWVSLVPLALLWSLVILRTFVARRS